MYVLIVVGVFFTMKIGESLDIVMLVEEVLDELRKRCSKINYGCVWLTRW